MKLLRRAASLVENRPGGQPGNKNAAGPHRFGTIRKIAIVGEPKGAGHLYGPEHPMNVRQKTEPRKVAVTRKATKHTPEQTKTYTIKPTTAERLKARLYKLSYSNTPKYIISNPQSKNETGGRITSTYYRKGTKWD